MGKVNWHKVVRLLILPTSALTDPMANLQINERSKEKVQVRGGTRPGRKRMGFYASLCNDVANVDLGSSSSPSSLINECSQPHGKSKKKSKHPKGSKYYSSLAEDVAAMRLGACQRSKSILQKVKMMSHIKEQLEWKCRQVTLKTVTQMF